MSIFREVKSIDVENITLSWPPITDFQVRGGEPMLSFLLYAHNIHLLQHSEDTELFIDRFVSRMMCMLIHC